MCFLLLYVLIILIIVAIVNEGKDATQLHVEYMPLHDVGFGVFATLDGTGQLTDVTKDTKTDNGSNHSQEKAMSDRSKQ